MITRILAVINKIMPLLDKKVPMFSQSIKQFSTSKSNGLGGSLIAAGCYFLYVDINSGIGMQLLAYGFGLLTIKDAIHKKG